MVTRRSRVSPSRSALQRYARAAAYFRSADLDSALPQIDSLLTEDPTNPYFLELRGQMLVESSRPIEGVPAYRKAAQFAPNEPLIQIGLASALLATENADDVAEAMRHLKTALKDEPDNAMGWYYLADAYSRNGDEARAALATAERYFALRGYDQAIRFARRAQPKLKESGRDWQRANDIISISQNEMSSRSRH